MKNRGFTLIELLAVIVILAIISLIAAPIVMNTIEKSKAGSVKESTYNIIKSAEIYFMGKEVKYGTVDVTSELLKYNGVKPTKGEVSINRDGRSSVYLYLNGYCITKEYDEEIVYSEKMDEDSCTWNGTSRYSFIEGKETTLSSDKIISNYQIYGNSIQTGEINPGTPQDLVSLGSLVTDKNDSNYGKYKINIVTSGKNLFNVKEYVDNANNMGSKGTIEFIDNGSMYQSTISYQENKSKLNLNLKSNTLYTFSFNNRWINTADDRVTTGFKIYYSDGSIGQISIFKDTVTQVYTTNKNKNLTGISSGGWGYDGKTLISNIQLEEGTQATTFEPYHESVTQSIYLDEPLRCVNNICDYIDYNKEEVVRKVNALTLKGDEEFFQQDSSANSNGYYSFILSILDGIKSSASAKQDVNSNYFNEDYDGFPSVNKNGIMLQSYSEASGLYIRIKDSTINSLETYKNWLSTQYKNNKPVIVYYQLENPRYESVFLPKINVFDDTTIVSVNDENINVSNVILTVRNK